MKPSLRAAILGLALAGVAHAAGWAQTADAPIAVGPKPIPAPPIPAPAQLGRAPALSETGPASAPRGKIEIPPLPNVAPVTPPPPHEKTPANLSDPAPLPKIGADAPNPPTISPGVSAGKIELVTLVMPAGASAVPDADQPKLAQILDALKRAPEARLEVRAYAPQTSPTDSKARRLSLARFFAVRDYLVKNGVPDSRIDARALGTAASGADADRIELYIER